MLRAAYHFTLAYLGALYYRFPSRHLIVIGVTGTKGKTSTLEIANAILETAGCRTALSSTLRFKIGADSRPNERKMTMPGRFFLQRFLHQAVKAKCQYALLEMTSEGARQFRHRFIDLDALIFTNLAPEHIESHGSYQGYRQAKLNIAYQLARSRKKSKAIIANGDDAEAAHFLAVPVDQKLIYRRRDAEPIEVRADGTTITYQNTSFHSHLLGEFTPYNLLAAITLARWQRVPMATIQEAVERLGGIRGRMEPISRQNFTVIVDYAHTPDSLRQVYESFPGRKKVCVLGAAGGGRDRWKRPVLGQIAAAHCQEIILTDEDPYNEDPRQIIEEVARGIPRGKNYQIVMDRRLAIRAALAQARPGDAVLITGKGTDPYIMGPRGAKTPWSDAAVAHEELERLKHEPRPETKS